MNCLFCKIIKGEIPSNKVYEDEFIYSFHDINKVSKHHMLIIPKKHISSLNDVSIEDIDLLGRIQLSISKIAKQEGFFDYGYRVVNNCGKNGMQTVEHLHYHLISGNENELLGWPPISIEEF